MNEEYQKIYNKHQVALSLKNLSKNPDFIVYANLLKNKIFDSIDPSKGQGQFDFLFGVKSSLDCVDEEISKIPEYEDYLESYQNETINEGL